MRETYALWITPDSLAKWVDEIGRPETRAEIEPPLREYVATACRPLLSLPSSERPNLPGHVVGHAIAGTESRLRMLFAIYAALGKDLNRFLDFATIIEHLVPDMRSRAAHLFEKTYIDCFEMGTRVYVRSVRRLMERLERAADQFVIPAEKAVSWYELCHVSACLDLCATSVLYFLEEDGAPDRAAVPEELCFLMKEYALSYGANIQLLLSPRGSGRENKDAGLTAEDQRWDRDFCRLGMPALNEHLKAS